MQSYIISLLFKRVHSFAVGVAILSRVWRRSWRITILRYARLRPQHFISDCLEAKKRWSFEHYRSNTARLVIVISLERHACELNSNNAIADEIYSFFRSSRVNNQRFFSPLHLSLRTDFWPFSLRLGDLLLVCFRVGLGWVGEEWFSSIYDA